VNEIMKKRMVFILIEEIQTAGENRNIQRLRHRRIK